MLALIFLGVFLFIMKRTRLGLEVRAVTQNPRMAASMGINPDRINMLTFGLGSGIAGVAGVAIGLSPRSRPRLGQDYIVQSFMTVVVGGVGNIWGTLLGATMIGVPPEGDRVLQPLQHARGADLHDHLHHHLHPVPAQGHHRPQGPGGGGLTMQQASSVHKYPGGPGGWPPGSSLRPGATHDPNLLRPAPPLGPDLPRAARAVHPRRDTAVRSLRPRPHLHLLRQDAGQDALPLPDRPRDGPGLGLHAASCRWGISPSSASAAT